VIAVFALAALLLAGCGSSGAKTTSAPGPAVGGAPVQGSVGRESAPGFTGADGAKSLPDAQPGAQSGAKPGAPNSSASAIPPVGVGSKLTRSGSLDLQVKDIAAAAARVRSIATGLQAEILGEQIGTAGPGQPTPTPVPLGDGTKPVPPSGDFGGFGTLTLSVPSDQLDTALDQLSKIGTVLGRNTSSQDVTAQYVDAQSRLKTMRASVDRVRALMVRAKDIGQVVALESEMSRREADLESLESQLAALKTSVERSPLTVSLSTKSSVEPVTTNGFLAGLRSGWDAFIASASGLFTGIGAVLPFAVFFALLGAPLVWWLRRYRANRPPAMTQPTGPSTTQPTGPSGQTAHSSPATP